MLPTPDAVNAAAAGKRAPPAAPLSLVERGEGEPLEDQNWTPCRPGAAGGSQDALSGPLVCHPHPLPLPPLVGLNSFSLTAMLVIREAGEREKE